MATEAKGEEKSEKQQPEGGSPPAQQEPKEQPAKEPAPKDKEPAEGKSAKTAGKQAALFDEGGKEKAPATRVLLDDEEDIPDTELFSMSKKAFTGRLERSNRAQLRELASELEIDVSNLRDSASLRDALKAHFASFKKLKAADTERRRAEMSELEKHKEDLAKEKVARAAAEARWTQAEEERAVEKIDGRVEKLALEYIDADDYEYVAQKLATHLRKELGEEKLAKMDAVPEKLAREFFADFVEKRPKFAKASAEEKDKPAARTVPLTNGAAGSRPDARPQSGNAGEKTAKPGQPNSFTAKELRDQGYRW